MPNYPRPCPKCGQVLERDGFAIDRSKASGRKSHCKQCDRTRKNAYYAAHAAEWIAQRAAAREAAWLAELESRAEEHRARVAEADELHAAQVRAQKKLLRSLGVL